MYKLQNNFFFSYLLHHPGMMDIALLTANANQLRFLITYNTESKTYYVSVGLIVASLIIQVAVGIALIFKVTVALCSSRSTHLYLAKHFPSYRHSHIHTFLTIK